jgi:hypothetical protein
VNYASCQELADAARAAGIDVIRYRSARDPKRGTNLALLACRAFTAPQPLERQTWHMRLAATGVHAVCEFPAMRLSFLPQTFAGDSRIAALDWQR